MAFPAQTSDDLNQGGEPSRGLSADQLKAENERLSAEIERERKERRREQERLDSFLTGQRKAETPAPKARPMPDPNEDPAGYAAWLGEQTAGVTRELTQRMDREREERNAAISDAEARGNLWNAMQRDFPAHAKLGDIANVAYHRLVEADDLPQDATAAAAAIARKMDALVGADIAKLQAPANRTAGTSGGDPPRIPNRQTASDDDEEPSVTMHSAISKFKVDHGLI